MVHSPSVGFTFQPKNSRRRMNKADQQQLSLMSSYGEISVIGGV